MMGSLAAQAVKNPPTLQETQVQFLGQERSLEKEMATHSSILAWRIPFQRSLAGYSPWKKVKNETEVAQSCPTLCDPKDFSLPGLSIHGIVQARALEWVAISFYRGSSRPRDWTWVSHIAGRHFTLRATREAHEVAKMLDMTEQLTLWNKDPYYDNKSYICDNT